MKNMILFLVIFLSFQANSFNVNCGLKKLKTKIAKETILNDKATFEEIQKAYITLKGLKGSPYNVNIDAKRLINDSDWAKAEKNDDLVSWLTYGENAIYDWEKGARYVNDLDPSTIATPSLLKKFHELSAENLPFHGFEGRRIRARYDQGNISEEEFKKNLQRAFKENENLHGIEHSSLTGFFRSSDFDRIVHKGSSFDENGVRYFTTEERDAMLRNPFVKVVGEGFKPDGDGRFRAIVHYLAPEKVEKAVEVVLLRTEKLLKKAKKPEDVVRIVEQMKIDLISIHPFLDGNGRSIRLLEDFLLRRHNLPPSLHPNEMDLVMPINDATELMRQQMIRYLNEHLNDYIHATQIDF